MSEKWYGRVNDDIDLKNVNLVSAEEIGINISPDDIIIDPDDEYQSIVDLCHDSNVDYNHITEMTTSNNLDCFTRMGFIANYHWFALTQLYSREVFKCFTEEQKKQNMIHFESIRPLVSLVKHLNNAFKKSHEIFIRARRGNLYVMDTSMFIDEYFENESGFFLNKEYGNTKNLVKVIRAIIGTDYSSVEEPDLEFDNDTIIGSEEDLSVIKGKDIILPFIYAEDESILNFAKMAASLCKDGRANTVTGFFVTRIMPSMDGKYPNFLSKEEEICLYNNDPLSDLYCPY